MNLCNVAEVKYSVNLNEDRCLQKWRHLFPAYVALQGYDLKSDPVGGRWYLYPFNGLIVTKAQFCVYAYP